MKPLKHQYLMVEMLIASSELLFIYLVCLKHCRVHHKFYKQPSYLPEKNKFSLFGLASKLVTPESCTDAILATLTPAFVSYIVSALSSPPGNTIIILDI